MGLWGDYFTHASWSGGIWGSGDFDDGDLAAADILLHHLGQAYRDDEVSEKVKGVDVLEAQPRSADYGEYPRIQLWSGTVETERAPTQAEWEFIGLYAVVVYELRQIAAIEPGEPTVNTMLHALKRVLQANEEVNIQVNGNTVNIVENMVLEQHGTMELTDTSLRPFAEALVVPFNYEVHVNHRTGRLYQIERA